jgi:hypothetical protein
MPELWRLESKNLVMLRLSFRAVGTKFSEGDQLPCLTGLQFNNAIGVQLPTGCPLPDFYTLLSCMRCPMCPSSLSSRALYRVLLSSEGPWVLLSLRFSCRVLPAIFVHTIRQRMYKVASKSISDSLYAFVGLNQQLPTSNLTNSASETS